MDPNECTRASLDPMSVHLQFLFELETAPEFKMHRVMSFVALVITLYLEQGVSAGLSISRTSLLVLCVGKKTAWCCVVAILRTKLIELSQTFVQQARHGVLRCSSGDTKRCILMCVRSLVGVVYLSSCGGDDASNSDLTFRLPSLKTSDHLIRA